MCYKKKMWLNVPFRKFENDSYPGVRGQERNISYFFSSLSQIFSHFSSMFLHFLPQLELRSEEAAHLGRPWLRLISKRRTNHFQPDLVYIEIVWCSVSLLYIFFNLFIHFYLFIYFFFNFRLKLGSFLSDFCQLSTSSWCLVKVLDFNLKSPWSLEKDAKSSLLKSSTHVVLPWLYKLRLFITENDKNSERLYINPRLAKLFFVTRLTKGGGLLHVCEAIQSS